MKLPVYLDYAATTPVDPQVASKMLHYLTCDGHYGNPASFHPYGQAAKHAVDEARAQVAGLINAEPSEIIWTSGATEANNLALKGAAMLYQRKGRHIITLKTEHPSVLDCCQQLEKQGFSVTYLVPKKDGLLDQAEFLAALREDTVMVSIMHINNEIGVIQDIQAIAGITAERGILFHVDAAQSAGKIPLNVQKIPLDLLSVCAHKIYGPKGIGALYLRRKPRVRVAPLLHGGGQEQGMRSGTLPVHQIVGMGEAFALAQATLSIEHQKMQSLRDRFLEGISLLQNVIIHGSLRQSYPGIINLSLRGIPAKMLVNALPQVAFSVGSACHAKGAEPSQVLRALGLTEELAQEAVRFSFGRFTTLEDIDFVINQLLLLRR
ncbi:MAG: iscS [Gammaproteobacteria bacterium]|jgi:cysteine desulfurase|nr:iscS [Gammaproteobacteria bacterium]